MRLCSKKGITYPELFATRFQKRGWGGQNVAATELSGVRVDRARLVPPIMEPLVRAADCGFNLVSEVEAIVRHFKFETFMYGVAVSPTPNNDSCIYAFSTVPPEWAMRYDQLA